MGLRGLNLPLEDWQRTETFAVCEQRLQEQIEAALVERTEMDWVVLALVFLPFFTGFLAYHQIGPYKFMIILHIISGEAMLAAIPFTRLSHMLFTPFARAYMGSEFGAVRKVKDW